MKTSLIGRILVLCLALSSSASATVYVWDDPTRVTGSSAIDPSGAVNVSGNATNSTAKATLTGLSTFGAIQEWTMGDGSWKTGGLGTTNQGIMNYADSTLPDIQFSLSGQTAGTTAGNQVANNSFTTSSGSAMRLSANQSSADTSAIYSFTLTVDFGNWNGSTFDSAANGVSAVGFTLTAPATRWTTDMTGFSAVFKDASGNVLSTQGLPADWPSGTSNSALYVGYLTSGEAISSVDITITGNYNTLFGLDDLGFTAAVPEPNTMALFIPAGLMLLILSRTSARRRTA